MGNCSWKWFLDQDDTLQFLRAVETRRTLVENPRLKAGFAKTSADTNEVIFSEISGWIPQSGRWRMDHWGRLVNKGTEKCLGIDSSSSHTQPWERLKMQMCDVGYNVNQVWFF